MKALAADLKSFIRLRIARTKTTFRTWRRALRLDAALATLWLDTLPQSHSAAQSGISEGTDEEFIERANASREAFTKIRELSAERQQIDDLRLRQIAERYHIFIDEPDWELNPISNADEETVIGIRLLRQKSRLRIRAEVRAAQRARNEMLIKAGAVVLPFLAFILGLWLGKSALK